MTTRRFPAFARRSRFLILAVVGVLVGGTAAHAQSPAFVQSNYAVPQTAPTLVAVPYPGAQTSGNLNVVAVGWNDATSSVGSVTDSSGNLYTRAVLTVQPGIQSQAIYYSANIAAAAANANVVTVTFSGPVSYPDVRVAEYSGIASVNPLDGAVGASGTGTSANSGALTTTNPSNVLIGASYVQSATIGPGAGYTQRLITSPNGSILEDRVVTATGSYAATAPTNGAGWVMQVAAFRAATAGPPDTEAPTAPTNLTAQAVSSGQVNLSWTASTDNMGVSAYRIERCQNLGCTAFSEIATTAGTIYSNVGLSGAVTYSYRVRATDGTNLSAYSNTATSTTPAAPDTQAPTVPTGLTTTATSATQIDLAWTASTDNVGVTLYRIERCQGSTCTTFAEVGTSATAAFSSQGLTASTTYRFRVRAFDAAGNSSAYSSIATSATPAASDTQPPTSPTNLSATPVSGTRINLAWTTSTDNLAVNGYRVERCTGAGCSNFVQIATTTTASYTNNSLTNGTSYRYRVRATDAAGNFSQYSSVATAQTLDTSAPTVPSFVTTGGITSSQVNLSWTASTDNVAVANYQIQRCQGSNCNSWAQIGTSTGPSYADTTLAASTTYRYRVRAADAAGNLSGFSTIVSATTTNGPDTQAPSVPTSLTTSVVSSTQITLAWTASIDNIAVTNYLVERCASAGCSSFAQVGTSAGVGYNDAGLTASTSYSYRVRATDAAGNLSGYSTVSTQITSATPPPPVLTFAQPPEGGTVTGSTLAVSYTTSGDLSQVNHVHFQLDTNPEVMDLSFDGVFQFLNVPPGAHILTGYLVRADHSKILGTDASVSFNTIADTQPPTVPVNLTATAAATQVTLAWGASSDNVSVTNYQIERCQGVGCAAFGVVGSTASAGYVDAGLTPSTTYSYRVRAGDAAGNLSGYSGTASVVTTGGTPATITYVQSNYAVPQAPQSSVNVPFTAVQTAGNLNIVIVGWSDAVSSVQNVSDGRGNTYTRAVLTVQPGVQSQAIYYASNIVGAGAGSNSVNVTFNAAVSYPDVRIVEYSGIDSLTPLVGAIGGTGTGTSASSGSLSVDSLSALLLGASYVQSTTLAAGSGYTQRLITSPNGSIVEDRVVTSSGSYAATAATGGSGWVMQLAAFRAGTVVPDLEPPSVPTNVTAVTQSSAQINLSWSASTDNVRVASYRVERCQAAGCTGFVEVGSSFTTAFSDTPPAPSTLYRYRVRASDGVNFSAYSTIVEAITGAHTPPVITMTLPQPGGLLSGVVTLSASVSGTGIGGVQFKVDGVNVGGRVGAPYTYELNTTKFANGSHSISAYTWDNLRTVVSAAPVVTTFSNVSAGNPAQTGMWSELFAWPLVSVHVNLLSDGRVLAWDKMDTGNPNPQLWDPITSSFLSVPTNDGANLFCAGQATLPDGRMLSAGGHFSDHVGLTAGKTFDPRTNQWTSTPDMAYGRWYPTLTTLGDGRILALSGEMNCAGCYASVPEVYNPVTNAWTALSSASLSVPYYPHAFLLPDGRVVVTGAAEAAIPTRVLDVATQTWSTIDSRLFDAYSSAMFLPGKIVKSGTSTDSFGSSPSSAKTYMLDMTAASPAWRQTASMAFPRAYHVLTTLPDGNVLVTGGGRTTGDYDIPNAVYAAELWSPTTETWTTLASAQAPRLYHGSALLLPDGRVLVSGGGRSPGPDSRDQESAEIFAPPNLFKGPRPTIITAPSTLGYNQAFTVATPDASRIAKVVLIGFGNMTHGFNMHQHYVPLTFTAGAGSLSVTTPSNVNLVPPGYYMLFLVDNLGVPSVASIVRF